MTDAAVMSPFLQRHEDTLVAKADVEDARLWSVTTILKVLSNPGLEYWQREKVSEYFVSIANSLPQRIEEEGVKEVIKAGINAPFRKPKDRLSAADLGTEFHAIAEGIAITGKMPETIHPELIPFVNNLDRWLQRAQPTFVAAEMPVYSTDYNFAGTCDGIMILDGVRFIFDWKTSAKSRDSRGNKTAPYPDTGKQLAAYRYATYAVPLPPRRFEQKSRRYYLFGEPERDHAVPVPKVDGAIAIKVTPEFCDAYTMRADDVIFERFLYDIEELRWQQEISKTVVRDVLIFPERGAT